MANVTRADVISSFESLFSDQNIIPEDLEYCWFEDALNEYEMEIATVEYDADAHEFTGTLPAGAKITLAYLMKIRYCERELSRVNKINNLYTKDVQLNGNGDTKKYTASELNIELARAKDFVNKQKVSYFVN